MLDANGEKTERVVIYNGKLTTTSEIEKELFLRRGWREVSWRNSFETFAGALVGSIGIFYANQALVELIENTLICHIAGIQSPIKVSKAVTLPISAAGAISNFFVSGGMTYSAKGDKQEIERLKNERERLKNEKKSALPKIVINKPKSS